jgi:hypothetical protein
VGADCVDPDATPRGPALGARFSGARELRRSIAGVTDLT